MDKIDQDFPIERPQRFLRPDEITYRCHHCQDTGFRRGERESKVCPGTIRVWATACDCEKGKIIQRGIDHWEEKFATPTKRKSCSKCGGSGRYAGAACTCVRGRRLAEALKEMGQ